MSHSIIRDFLEAWLARAIGADRRAAVLFGRILNARRCVACARHYARIAATHGQFEHAEEALARAAGWAPRHAAVWQELARIRARMGWWPEAASALERLVRLQPLNADAWFELADAHIALGQYAYAIPALRKVHDLVPASPRPLYLIGICQHHCGNERGLRDAVEQVAERDLQRATQLLTQTGRSDWRIPGVSC